MGTWGWPSRGWPEQGAAPPACSAWTQAPRRSQQCGELWLSPALCPDLRGGEARLVLTDTDLPAGACVSAGHGRQAGRGCSSAYGRSLLGDPRDIWGAQSEGRARAPFLQARGEGTRLAVTGVACWGPRSQGPTPPHPANTGRSQPQTCILSQGGGHGSRLQCSCQENPMDRGVWEAAFRRVGKSQTGL